MPDAAEFCPVAALADLADGSVRRIDLTGHAILLARTGDVVHACEILCPHEKADLAGGRIVGGRLVCPRHLASFDLTDGTVSAGWQVDRLRRYPVRIQAGRIEVDVAAVRRDPPGGARQVWDFSTQRP